MKLTVNGAEHDVLSAPLSSLLEVLREELFLTSPKAGCQQGGCGSCTVLVDGVPQRACLTPLAAVEGAEIETVEGLGTSEELSVVQAAFHQSYAAQCGYCTGGFMMATQALVERGESLDRDEVRTALAGHICRCTGYVKIVDAVQAAVNGEPETGDEADMGPRPAEDVTLVPGSPA
ncbi:MAG TPA: (2Fe-2S)-binding protein [Solirubrobacteraceae bacterium]